MHAYLTPQAPPDGPFILPHKLLQNSNVKFPTIFTHYQKKRSMEMKAISVSVFRLILTSKSSFVGGCSKHNHDANLEAMACQFGYTWDEEACVEALQA